MHVPHCVCIVAGLDYTLAMPLSCTQYHLSTGVAKRGMMSWCSSPGSGDMPQFRYSESASGGVCGS